MSEVKTLYKKIKLLEDELSALKRDAKTVFQSVAQREHWAEEYECAMMHLNDLGVPKDDGKGNTYSLVGRIDLETGRMKDEK